MPASKFTDNTILTPTFKRTASVRDISRVVQATGGNQVNTVGGFKYHLFSTTSTFNVSTGGTVGILLIGGGGGGGNGAGGGGGGGAIEPASGFTSVVVESGVNYTVTIGSGGAAQTSGGTTSIVIGPSTFNSLGGGRGLGTPGGSGGGGKGSPGG